MLRCVIVDDEKQVRLSIAKMIEMFCPDVEIVGSAANIIEAKTLILSKSPDVVFLDVEMPGGSGFDLLESLETVNFKVIFTTAHAAYAIKAIKYAAMDYLLKPLNVQELEEAIQKCKERSSDSNYYNDQVTLLNGNMAQGNNSFSKIALPTAEGIEFMDVDDIIRCEADRAYCNFYLKGGKKMLISKPMAEYEEILTEANFLKVHKSNIVNINYITKYIRGKTGDLVLSDGSVITVAARRKKDVCQALGIIN
ncbi:MAG: LytTR family DNA-binding domain-containing protein [bacterium]|nr:LytTR family DNA-binding domain-containing protein [bacterium]